MNEYILSSQSVSDLVAGIKQARQVRWSSTDISTSNGRCVRACQEESRPGAVLANTNRPS